MTIAPSPWQAHITALTTLRALARAERRIHGHLTPRTRQALLEATSAAFAALAIDDARRGKVSA